MTDVFSKFQYNSKRFNGEKTVINPNIRGLSDVELDEMGELRLSSLKKKRFIELTTPNNGRT